jgi:hypothetical protein
MKGISVSEANRFHAYSEMFFLNYRASISMKNFIYSSERENYFEQSGIIEETCRTV